MYKKLREEGARLGHNGVPEWEVSMPHTLPYTDMPLRHPGHPQEIVKRMPSDDAKEVALQMHSASGNEGSFPQDDEKIKLFLLTRTPLQPRKV